MKEHNFDLTNLEQMAVMHHELYECYKKAGFSKGEAIYLVGQFIQSMGNNG